jgi:ribosomal protein L29
MVYEELKQNDKALKLYNQIKDSYPKSAEARDIEKDIARNNTILGKIIYLDKNIRCQSFDTLFYCNQ